MLRFLPPLALLAACATLLPAAPVPTVPPDAMKDREGNPLPKGATARLGSLSLRVWPGSQLSFSTDGKQLRSNIGWHVLPFNAETGRPLPAEVYKPPHKEQDVAGFIVGNRAFTLEWDVAPGKFVDDDTPVTVTTWNLEGKEISRVASQGRLHTGDSIAPSLAPPVAVSRDGRTIAIVSAEKKRVEVYDTETGKQLHTQPTSRYDNGVVISPDGKTLYAYNAGHPIRRCELLSGKALPDLEGADKHTDYLTVSSDGKRVVTRGNLWEKGANGKEQFVRADTFLRVHDAKANKVIGKLDVGVRPDHFTFAGAEGVIVIVANYRSPLPPQVSLERWNAKALKREWSTPLPPLRHTEQYLVASPDGKKVAVTDRKWFAFLFNAETGKPVVEPECHSRPVTWVSFKANGDGVVTAAEDAIRAWTLKGESQGVTKPPELARGRVQPELLGEHFVWVSYSENGKKAELVGWDREKGKIGWRMPVDGEGPARVLTHDGKRCVGISLNAAKRVLDVTLYDGPAGKKLHAWTYDKVENGSGCRWWPMAISADGNTLFIGGDGVAGLEVITGKEILRIGAGQFKAEDVPAASPLAVSGDGKRIAVIRGEARRGQIVRVFDIKTGKELVAHSLGAMHKPWLRFSPNGKSVAVWDKWSTAVTICDAESSQAAPRKLNADSARPTCAAFSPNGASLAVGYEDGTALIWDLSAK